MHSEKINNETGEISDGIDRYWISSLSSDAVTPGQWLLMARNHWSVENENHHTYDTPFAEDKHHWITADARGFIVVLLLRRIAYNLLAFLRRVTLRSENSRTMPWKSLMAMMLAMTYKLHDFDRLGLSNQGVFFVTQ